MSEEEGGKRTGQLSVIPLTDRSLDLPPRIDVPFDEVEGSETSKT
jgi:hypothetical protein